MKILSLILMSLFLVNCANQSSSSPIVEDNRPTLLIIGNVNNIEAIKNIYTKFRVVNDGVECNQDCTWDNMFAILKRSNFPLDASDGSTAIISEQYTTKENMEAMIDVIQSCNGSRVILYSSSQEYLDFVKDEMPLFSKFDKELMTTDNDFFGILGYSIVQTLKNEYHTGGY